MVRNEKIKSEWKDRVNKFTNSGLSMRKWCEANGYKLCTLHYWIKKFKDIENKSGVKWAIADMNNHLDSSKNSEALTVKLGLFSIEVRSGFEPKLLQDIVKVLSTQ
jgi:hypothetical protein